MKYNETLDTQCIENDSTTRVHTTISKRKETSPNNNGLYGIWVEQGYEEDGHEGNSYIFIDSGHLDKTIALLIAAQQTIKDHRNG